ncbi:hypothetical protein DFH28DRAFT_894230 [Melampsora americana]|nr:hypothetical protein DFH28DRAFT_894230 [Melampsora americana]
MNQTKAHQQFEQILQSFRLLPLSQSNQSRIPSRLTSALNKRPVNCPNESPFKDLIIETQSNDQWNLSNHLFPAAYPRTIKGSALSKKSNQDSFNSLSQNPSNDRSEMAKRVYEANRDSQRLDQTLQSDQIDERQLYISVNRYHRNPSTSFHSQHHHGLTLILSHANGLHKETWEPMLSFLLHSPESDLIDEIWSLDCVNQGDSAILNQDSLGERFYWADTSRDLLQFIISYLPERENGMNRLPMNLSKQVLNQSSLLNLDSKSSFSLTHTKPIHWRGRKICLIGHSLGGNASALAVSSLPELFNSVIFVDPVIIPPTQTDEETEATVKFRASLSVHRLFADPFFHSSLAYERLKNLSNFNHHDHHHQFKPKLHFIYADENQSIVNEPVLKEYINELNTQGSKVIRIQEARHLMVQEIPKRLASDIGSILKEIHQVGSIYKL